uniref:Uncharacterized protein n=1 Tax=Arundo donax TaxID=35708 RepID=A0A0A8ZQ23_ARUDO
MFCPYSKCTGWLSEPQLVMYFVKVC